MDQDEPSTSATALRSAFQSDYDYESESERELQPPSSKRKFSGSAVYNTKYDAKWRQKYPCIQAVKGDSFSFSCTVCCKVMSCKHMGIGDVKRHIEAVGHRKAAKGMESQSRLPFASADDPVKVRFRVDIHAY